jgi:hypothetical protein
MATFSCTALKTASAAQEHYWEFWHTIENYGVLIEMSALYTENLCDIK